MTLKGSSAVVTSVQTVTANVTVRLVDVETLKIVGTGMGTGKSSSKKSEVNFKVYRNNPGYVGNRQVNITVNAELDGNKNVNTAGIITMDDPSFGNYFVRVDNTEVSATQVRNALGKAVRDAVYGKSGILTQLNGGKQLDIKTDF